MANANTPFQLISSDLIDAPPSLTERYFLKPFQLIDLGQIDDEILKQHVWSGVMEFALLCGAPHNKAYVT